MAEPSMVGGRRVRPARSPTSCLILGVLVVAFPIYYVFVASTHTLQTILAPAAAAAARRPTCSANYAEALVRRHRPHRRRQRRPAAAQHHDRGARHRHRQDRHLDRLGLRHRLLPLPAAHGLLLADLHHPDAAGRGPHPADLQGDGRPRPDRHLRRPDPAADRLGHRDAAVPPVLPDHPERARSRPPASTAPARGASSRTSCCRCRRPTSRRSSSSSSSTAGPSISGRCWSPTRNDDEHHRHRAPEDDLLRRCRHRPGTSSWSPASSPSCRRSSSSC